MTPELAELRTLTGPQVPPHQWFWDGNDHVDPLKEANAQSQRLLNLTTTLADEYGARGMDWEAKLRQRAKEIGLINELGLPLPQVPGQAMQPADDEEPPARSEVRKQAGKADETQD